MEGVVVEVATTVAAYLATFRLVHDAYVARGWIRPQPSSLWVTPHQMLPESTVFVLRRGEVCLGTVALIEDSGLGLPIDHTFPDETTTLRGPGRHLVEVGSLAVAPEIRGTGLVAVLMGAMWRYARHRLAATDLAIAVSADVGDYYEALFRFRGYTPVRHYEGFGITVTDADYDPVVGLHQSVAEAAASAKRIYAEPAAGFFNIRSLIEAPFPAPFEQLPPARLPQPELVRYKLSRTVFQELFDEHTDLLANLDERTRVHLGHLRTRETLQRHRAISLGD